MTEIQMIAAGMADTFADMDRAIENLERQVRSCRICGCTDPSRRFHDNGDPGHWVERDLCSVCAGPEQEQ